MSAPLYHSVTRAIPIPELPTALRNAMVTAADKKKIGLAQTRAWLTQRENPVAAGLMGKLFGRRSNSVDPDASHVMALVLHATHILVGTSGAARGTSVLCIPLVAATVTRGSFASSLKDGPSDDGLNIHGFPAGEGLAGTYFMALGPGPDANACAGAVMDAVTAAKTPA